MITTFLLDSIGIETIVTVALGIFLIIAVILCFVIRSLSINKGKILKEQEFHALGKDAEQIIEDAKKQGEKIKKDMVYEAKQEINSLKQTHEREVKERKAELLESEKKLEQREDRLDSRSLSLDKREDALSIKENKIENQKVALDKRSEKVEELIQEQENRLLEISGLTTSEAKDIVMKRIEEEMSFEIASYIKEEEEKANNIPTTVKPDSVDPTEFVKQFSVPIVNKNTNKTSKDSKKTDLEKTVTIEHPKTIEIPQRNEEAESEQFAPIPMGNTLN